MVVFGKLIELGFGKVMICVEDGMEVRGDEVWIGVGQLL